MAEVLSQSQIDALLNSVRSGEKDLETVAADQPEKRYRKYDFASPRKFTKDRIKMLNGIFESYAHIINSRLNARLRTNCEITVESIEEHRYYEFSNALTEGDVLALSDVYIKEKKDNSPMLFYMSVSTALTIMDRMMGGEGNLGELPTDYSYTDVEIRIYNELMQDMISVLPSSWENMYLPVDVKYSRTDPNPTFNQIIGLDEIVIIVDMKMQFSNIEGRMSVCIPGDTLTNIFTELARDNPMRKAQGERKADEIFNSLRDSDLEIVAELGQTRLSLRDIYHLNVGDVIDLGRSKDSSVFLEIGGYQWFTGKMGTHKKNMAVKIDDVCYQAEQRSE
jgi:flagellar motor switch protein FliM